MHSLAIARFIQFVPDTRILDVGTGGGFPGIPLAIFFPQCQFHLTDSIAKKITIVHDVIEKLELTNAKAECVRSETLTDQYDFVCSRAVAPAAELISWSGKNISKTSKNNIPNGFLFLKGGNLSAELQVQGYKSKVIPLTDYFNEPFFAEEKKLVYITRKN